MAWKKSANIFYFGFHFWINYKSICKNFKIGVIEIHLNMYIYLYTYNICRRSTVIITKMTIIIINNYH